MAIRRILCLVDGHGKERGGGAGDGDAVLPTAMKAARAHGAFLDVLHVALSPQDAIPVAADGMTATMVEDIMASVADDSRQRAQRAETAFHRAAAEVDMPVLAAESGGPEGVAASFRVVEGREPQVVANQGLLYDLIVLGRRHGAGEPPATPTLEAAVMETGRPVLVAPPEVPATIGRRAAVAWRATVPGAHALQGALPILQVAEEVKVITVEESGAKAVPDDVVRYLAYHDVRGSAATVSAHGREAGQAILEAASQSGADLLVMGAYAHSRLRQLILGGVTATVLRSASLPLLLAH